MVTFRLMEDRDLDEIMRLEAELFGTDAWPRDSFEAELFQPETREYWVGVTGEGDGSPDGAGERVVAYGGIMCVPPVADIMTIGVAQDHQGQGLGRRLLEILIEASRLRAAEDILLEVRSDNDRAQDLYHGCGFTAIHTRRKYYRDGADAVIMQKVLGEPGGTTTTQQEAARG